MLTTNLKGVMAMQATIRHKALGVIIGLLVVVCTMVALSPSASAWVVRDPYGSPGSAYVTAPLVHGWKSSGGWANVLVSRAAGDSNGLYVYRSPAYSGTQKITATYRFWKLTSSGRQPVGAPVTNAVYVAPGAASWITGAFLRDSSYVIGQRYLAADVVVRWYTSGGTFLGQKTYDMNAASDYRCYTNWPDCETGTQYGHGYIWLSSSAG